MLMSFEMRHHSLCDFSSWLPEENYKKPEYVSPCSTKVIFFSPILKTLNVSTYYFFTVSPHGSPKWRCVIWAAFQQQVCLLQIFQGKSAKLLFCDMKDEHDISLIQ